MKFDKEQERAFVSAAKRCTLRLTAYAVADRGEAAIQAARIALGLRCRVEYLFNGELFRVDPNDLTEQVKKVEEG